MAKFNSKKKKVDDGLDVLDEIKEPFSFARFYEDHIVKSIKKIKRMLDERGILFFFMSPFQQRNRLIIQLVLIVFGILVGIVPRSMSLLDDIRERNASSAMASMIEKETIITSGSINIKPLASSCYDKQHVLAFLIKPANGSTIPSIVDRYFVNVSANSGVVYAEDVEFSYDIIPFTDTDRILLIYTDHRKQDDMSGLFNIIIENKEDHLGLDDKHPIDVVLSNTQKTTALFDAEGIHLNSLSDILFNDKKQPIADGRASVEKALSDYTLETERIQNQPVEMNPIPSAAVLENFVMDNEFYPLLTDKSDTSDILEMTELTPEELNISLKYTGSIELNGVEYNNEYFTNGDGANVENLTEDEMVVQSELNNLQKAIDKVMTCANNLNNAMRTRFDKLNNFKLIFNQPIDPASFKYKKHVTLNIQAAETEEDGSTETSSETGSTEATSEGDTSTETSEEISTEASEEVSTESSTSSETSEEVSTESSTSSETSEEVSTESSTSSETSSEEVPIKASEETPPVVE